MSDYIERQVAIDALEKVAGFFPYKIPGNADTYDKYNEAWNDAIGRAEMEMESLEPAEVLPYTIAPDGTLTVTVPKGTEVSRVLVEEDGTQWGGLFYAD